MDIRMRPFVLASMLAGVASLASCSLVIDASVGNGIGAACEAASDCQGNNAVCDQQKTCTLPCGAPADCPTGSLCVDSFCRTAGQGALGDACATAADCSTAECLEGLCVSPCSTTPDCPGGAVCVEGACQLEMVAGFIFDNQVSNATEGFALAHELGRQEAVQNLPWLKTLSSESNDNDTVSASIEKLLGEGADVMVVTTNRFATEAEEKAKANPDTQFLTFSVPSNSGNYVGYDVRYHQAWFLAGYVAARFDPDGKIGFVGAVPFPEVMRQLNAFAVGALTANPAARVEIVWANSFVPSDDIAKKLVDYLIAGGNRVIVNRLGTGTTVKYVADLHDQGQNLYSIGINNPNACDSGPTSCLGSPYFNWGPLYTRVLDSIHRHTFDPTQLIDDPILVDPDESTFHFALNSKIAGLDGLKPDIVLRIGDLVGPNGEDQTFAGGFCVTDAAQRPGKPACSPKGTIVDDAELASMCWLAKGIVQPQDPEDPTSPLVDAPAPDGSILWPPKSVDPSSLTKPSCQ